MRNHFLLYLFTGILIASCMNAKNMAPQLPDEETSAEEKTEQQEETTVGQSDYQENDTVRIWVSSRRDTLPGEGNRLGLVTQENVKYPSIEGWECKYQRINGFVFEPGYTCLLKAKVEMVGGEPQLRMVEMVSKMMDMDYYRINDIWAVTHLNGKPIALTEKRPNMEVNLKMMKILGMGGCNNYMGKIERYTPEEILFGPIAGTKMMCENMEQEQAFMSAMADTRSYSAKNLQLIFFDEEGDELIRFQKVD